MAVFNTSADSANTGVRAFLTKVGSYYLGHDFNTSSGKGKAIWEQILKDFNSSCAYCGVQDKLQIEHLVMFNREEYGLHHPGNTVPLCHGCNKRGKNPDGTYLGWKEQLATKCKNPAAGKEREKSILSHISKYNYPNFSENELNAIRVIAQSLYKNIQTECEKSLDLYKELECSFNKKNAQTRPPSTKNQG
jgi:hypothetical protein